MKLPPKRDILTGTQDKKIKPLDDMALFHKEMGNVQPLEQETTHRESTSLEPLPIFQEAEKQYATDSVYSEEFEVKTVGNEEILSFQRSGVQDRLFSQLRQGQLRLDAELDLHGMTIAVAHQQLAEFIDECRRQNIRCVRIIHGKGWGSKDNQPVLKTKLNAWLQQEDNVLAFCSTPIEAGGGGAGAVFVLLRRQQK
ncbi:MAG: Smr/MutS family protein [Gammaproteobacteria bacterium]|nr:Smr/MutS family protein [Gammaproteobacteria bacterium]